jgi:hypothetical protein
MIILVFNGLLVSELSFVSLSKDELDRKEVLR